MTTLALFALLPVVPPASGQTPPSTVLTPSRQMPAVTAAAPDSPPASCHVTLPSDGRFVPPAPFLADPAANMSGLGKDQFWYGSSKLWTMLPVDGMWRGWQAPAKPGDFAYGNKIPWFRADSPRRGPVTITGTRLDGPAPAFTETWGIGIGGINIPVGGCWQITARFQNDELSFRVWVVPARGNTGIQGTLTASAQGAPKPGENPRRIYVDREAQAKNLVYQVTPEIPRNIDASGFTASVLLHATIDTRGRPRDLEYISGPSALAQAAIDAVTWWQYRVEIIDDEAVEVDTTIEVEFPPSRNF